MQKAQPVLRKCTPGFSWSAAWCWGYRV